MPRLTSVIVSLALGLASSVVVPLVTYDGVDGTGEIHTITIYTDLRRAGFWRGGAGGGLAGRKLLPPQSIACTP